MQFKRLALIGVTLGASIALLVGCSSATTAPKSNNTSKSSDNTVWNGSVLSSTPSNSTSSNTTNNSPSTNTIVRTSPVSVPTRTFNGATTNYNPVLQFPTIVQMAMSHFKLSNEEAPTNIPLKSMGSSTLFYHAWQEGYSAFLQYDVLLSSPSHPLAQFSGTTFNETSLSQGYQSMIAVQQTPQGKLSKISLGDGITAIADVFTNPTGSAKQVQSASYTWKEGKWNILVYENGTTTLPTDTAKEVVYYLHIHFLPVPHNKAAITVEMQPGETSNGQPTSQPNIDAIVTWQDGSEVFQISTFNYCKNPVQTALSMAVSMKQYPGQQ